jgi:hypothetical protein
MNKTMLLLCCLLLTAFHAVQSQNAPVTTTGVVVNAVPGTASVPIPVTVTGFTNIAQFTLTMKFDTTKVRYVSSVPNASLPGMTIVYTSPSGNTFGKLVFSWSSATNVSLADGSALANLVFSYVTSTGLLSWSYTYGSVCQYKSWIGATLTRLNDDPRYQYYIDGGIANRGAPVTTAPVIVRSSTGAFQIPITVTAFTSIGSLTLYLEYDPLVITYSNSFTKNAAFGSTFLVGDNAGTGGKRYITIQWYGNPVTLANGATLCTLNFNYISVTGASCGLNWFDNGPSCEYADGSSNVLIDNPTSTYYKNGGVAPPLAANFMADNLVPADNATVQFTDLSTGGATAWEWSFNRATVVFVNGTNYHSQNPKVQFTEGGLYTVTLTASNIYLTDPEVKADYIRAGTPGIWTGTTSAAWNVTTNWDNWLVPAAETDIVIPGSAPNWPVYDGDLTIGVHVRSLTLNSAASQITITGDLVIP